MVESLKPKDNDIFKKLPEFIDEYDNPCVVIFGGSFAPFHMNHLRLLEFSKLQLESLYNFNIIGFFIVPTHDFALRKKHHGAIPIQRENRKALIDISICEYEWILPYYGVINEAENEGLGKAIREIVKHVKQKYVKSVTIISLQGADNLENAVRIAQATLGNQKVGIVMNRKEHFEKFKDTEKQMSEDPLLSKQVLWLKDESKQDIDISATQIREIVNSKQYEKLEGMLSEESIKFHIENNITYNIGKAQKQEKKAAIKLEEFADLSKVKVIEDSQLKMLRDWPIILGKGVQGVVEQMIYRNEEGEEINVAVKKTKINQQRRRRLDTFAREVKALTRIKHPNVIGLHGVGAYDEIVFSVMDLCKDGVSGWDFTRKNWNTIKEKFPIEWIESLSQLALGCGEMSRQGILHRDLTLDNILVFENGEERPVFKICDFGVSAVEEDKHLLPRGKCRNYSPEGIQGKETYCTESDLYMFGLIIWEMAHNLPVWNKFNTHDANKQVMEGKLPEFTGQNCPQELVDLINHCLAFEKEKRPTFDEASAQLHEIYLKYKNE